MQYTIRKFRPDEATAYKSIRLEALQSNPECFGNSYSMELAFESTVWSERLMSPHTACFGLYADDSLIGLTSIYATLDKPGEGYLTQSYIRREYRGMGLSAMLYNARIEWAKETGLQSLIVGHRAGNLVSKAANQRHGFSYTHSERRTWPDGTADDMLYYSLALHTG